MSTRARTKRAWRQFSREESSLSKKHERLSRADKTFLVSHQGALYTVYRMPDATCEITLGMAGFSSKPIRRGTRRWQAIMRKARSEVNLFEVELIMTT